MAEETTDKSRRHVSHEEVHQAITDAIPNGLFVK